MKDFYLDVTQARSLALARQRRLRIGREIPRRNVEHIIIHLSFFVSEAKSKLIISVFRTVKMLVLNFENRKQFPVNKQEYQTVKELKQKFDCYTGVENMLQGLFDDTSISRTNSKGTYRADFHVYIFHSNLF